MDGDGRADLVNVHASGAVMWRATADGRFEHVANAFPPYTAKCTAIALADVDADGDLDCITANQGTGSAISPGPNLVFANDGTGHFTAAPNALVGLPEAHTSLAVGDVDGDGDVDIVVGVTLQTAPPFPGGSAGRNRLFLNNGTGTFAEASTQLPPHQDPTKAVVLADCDGDGDLDLFCGNDPQPVAAPDRLYGNNGSGVFTDLPGALPVEARHALAAHARDFDQDGDVDLLLHDAQGIRYLGNAGSAVFTQLPAATPLLNGIESFVSDWNGDGRIDYALRTSSHQLAFVLNVATNTFVHQPAMTRPLDDAIVVAADFESDGDIDFVVSGTLSNARVLRNEGNGAYRVLAPDLPPPITGSMVVRAADFDGDGDVDVLGASGLGWTPLRRYVYRNDGSATFTSVPAGDFTLDTQLVTDLALGDVDGDGDLDALAAAEGAAATALYLNAGGLLNRVAFPAASTIAVALGDLDGDGDLDAFLANPTQNHVAINQGGGVFAQLAGAPPTFQANGVVLADVDGDGDLDAVAAAYPTVVLINDGAGGFTALAGALAPDWANAVAAFDCDGDQDVDLVLSSVSWSGAPSRLHRNNGTGIFVLDPQAIPGNTSGTFRSTHLDVDGDGDQDLVTVALSSPNLPGGGGVKLFANNGAGQFAAVSGGVTPTAMSGSFPAASDFDGDQDVDVFVGDFAAPHLYRNSHRQIAWFTLPRVGKSLVLDLRGRANEPFALGLALAPTNLPIPGIGTLRLDPGSLQLIATGAYDASGRATFQAPVPNVPGLIGLSLYWQALSGAPPTLGNLEVTTLLAL